MHVCLHMHRREVQVKRLQWIVQLLLSVILIAFGLFILFGEKETFITIIMVILGTLAIVSGIVSIATLGTYKFGKFNHGAVVVKSTVAIIVGVLAIILPLATLYTTWKIFIYILAAEMALSSIISFLTAVAAHSHGLPVSRLIQEGLISLLVAVVLFIFPEGVGSLIVVILGIAVMVVGATIGGLAIYQKKHSDKDTIETVEVEITKES